MGGVESANSPPFDKARQRGILQAHLSPPLLIRALKRVLFVCTGNTCRSPMAETLFRELVKGRSDYEVASAGLGAMPGDKASRHTADLMKEQGHDLSNFRSQMLSKALVKEATHIFAMGYGHLRAIEKMFPEAADKAYLVSEFCAEDRLRGQDVSDPYGGSRADYEETREVLTAVLPSLVAYIDQTFDKLS
jgi:protein-tyrosine phosphatase